MRRAGKDDFQNISQISFETTFKEPPNQVWIDQARIMRQPGSKAKPHALRLSGQKTLQRLDDGLGAIEFGNENAVGWEC